MLWTALQEFITPIVKASKGVGRVETFYTIPEYEAWKAAHNDGSGWTIKVRAGRLSSLTLTGYTLRTENARVCLPWLQYYKGLGTSTAQEAKEYFSDLQTHRIGFRWQVS